MVINEGHLVIYKDLFSNQRLKINKIIKIEKPKKWSSIIYLFTEGNKKNRINISYISKKNRIIFFDIMNENISHDSPNL
jgi:hypothetical protein